MQIKDFLKIYGAIILFHLAVIFREDTGQMLYLSKPLIIISLILFAQSKLRAYAKYWLLLLPALVFSLIGDLALMFSEAPAFLIGMGAFALAHLFYILLYAKAGLRFKPIPIFGAVAFAGLSLYLLLLKVELPSDLQIPIFAYFGFLALHLIFATLSYTERKLIWPLIGIALFIFSDWWIAYSKFGGGFEEHWHNRILIMFTYAVAQGAIILGLIQGKEAKGGLHHK
jgi:uncharacterized membrane protein YhhN